MKNSSPAQPPPPIDRSDLIRRWLTATGDPRYTAFPCTVLSEAAGIRAAVEKPLSETVFIHHADPEIAKKKLARLGYPKLADALDRRPKSHNTRMGNFGEVVASEFLRQLRGYEIPVYRLRYNTNDESSPKGDDVLAFEFADRKRGVKDTVIVAEVKVRGEFKSEVVKEAHDALRKGFRPRPKSFPFVVEILYREGRDHEAEKLLDLSQKFGKRSLVRKSCLFLVTEKVPTDPFGTLTKLKRLAPSLEAVHLALGQLTGFVDTVFEAEVDVDGL